MNIVIPSFLNEDLHPLDKKWFNGMGPDKAGGPNKVWGPNIDLRTPWKVFSLRPWLERLILYNINEDNNVQQAKLSASQYGFRAGVSTETALHEFVRHVEHCLVRKKPALNIFLDIVGAFDNVTFRSFVAALQGLGMSKVLTSWIENLLRHRTVQVELYGDKVKNEVVKGNPQGGILSPFLWNSVLNNLLLELRSRGFYVQAYADDLAVLVTGADMLWIRGMAQKAINIATNWALD